MVCCVPLEVSTSRKTCPGICQRQFKSERRKARSVRLWVQIEHGEAKRMWLPKRFVKGMDGMDMGVSGPSGARRATLWEKAARKSKAVRNA